MSKNAQLHFDQLNLHFGQLIEILPNPGDPTHRYDCVLVGCLPGDAVIIAPPESGQFPVLHEGQQLVIRVSTLNGVAFFPSMVLHIAETPIYLAYLDFPSAIQFKQIRNTTRIDIALPVLVSNMANSCIRGVAGRISDISLGGARLDFNAGIGNKGDEIELKGKFEIASIKRVLAVHGVIRSVKQLGERFTYGIEFHEQDEDKQLILFGFIYNAMADGKPKGIE